MALPGPASAALEEANQAFQDGNYAEAYDLYAALATATDSLNGEEAKEALTRGFQCLVNLGRYQEIDAYLESWTTSWPNSWQVLSEAARNLRMAPKRGHLVDGVFQREHWGPLDASDRDRVLSLQLMLQAQQSLDGTDEEKAGFYASFAELIPPGNSPGESWKLQHLTDLSQLPDYEEGRRWDSRKAPVDENGNPVFYEEPDSWESAKNDGERWRWALRRWASFGEEEADQAHLKYGEFLIGQFGVNTLQSMWGFQSSEDLQTVQTLARKLRELTDEETMAALASGPQHISLPQEHNHISIFKELTQSSHIPTALVAFDRLINLHISRDQRTTAAQYIESARDRFQDDDETSARLTEWNDLHRQITGNFGQFDGTRSEAAGKPFTVGFFFRNATSARFQARRINFELLLDDLKTYLRSNPDDLDYRLIHLSNLGARLLEEDQQKYLAEEVASWETELEPREDHLDARTEIETPLRDAGAYWLESNLPDGNKTSIIVWISDTAIVRKNLTNGAHYFVADAASGTPVQRAQVEFFGYEQKNRRLLKGVERRIVTETLEKQSNETGEVRFEEHQEKRWLVTATTSTGRFAYLGFDQIWRSGRQEDPLDRVQMFTITDRPVYRPEHAVKFKIWIGRSSYEQVPTGEFEGRPVDITIKDPSGEDVHQASLIADSYGGVSGEFTLPPEAKLGVYSINIESRKLRDYSSFRVEEYKKPEFEVVVDAPDEPISLGEKFSAKITAKYYFGAPVTQGEVKVKVTRNAHNSRFFPAGPWDWLYGKGYAYDLPEHRWYPGWNQWGCLPPLPPWGNWRGSAEELVMEDTLPLGPNGTVELELDTALALELHGDEDHQYTIDAEVTDASRRTITGSGSVIAARKPFEVFIGLNRGFYEAGDTIEVTADARTPDGKPVAGEGKVILYQVTYNDEGEPEETEVFAEDAAADEDGHLEARLKAADPGQYRIACQITTEAGETEEGARLIVIRGDEATADDFRFNDLELIPDKPTYVPGDTMKLLINTNREDSTVVLFLRPVNGICQDPQILSLDGRSNVQEIQILDQDQPNIFVEAYTVSDGEVHQIVKEIAIPPVERKLNLEVVSSEEDYRPGQEASVTVKLTQEDGTPYHGQTVLAVYDKALEYISGGSNIPDILSYFWGWKRDHYPERNDNLGRRFGEYPLTPEDRMRSLGLGIWTPDMEREEGRAAGEMMYVLESPEAPGEADSFGAAPQAKMRAQAAPPAPEPSEAPESPPLVEAVVRSDFADSIFWASALETGEDGQAVVDILLPDNLTTWKIKGWAMAEGTRVGQGETEFITSKKLVLRQQAPRFFVEKDEVTLSANVHNYLDVPKSVQVSLELEGESLGVEDEDTLVRTIDLDAGGEERVDWIVDAATEGETKIRMKALTDVESDAVEMSYPVLVHGMLKTEAWSGVVRPEEESATVAFEVPWNRKPEQSRLEIRYSPSIAASMVDALPYLIDYPYGCTEQTVNRFVPCVITRRVLSNAGISLDDIRNKAVNLNPQQLGDAQERAAQWKEHVEDSPVFNERRLERLINNGLEKLTALQNDDGGWGWFKDQSGAHTTSVVVNGLQRGIEAEVGVDPAVYERGLQWLMRYQRAELRKLDLPDDHADHKSRTDNLDALVASILAEEDRCEPKMLDALYEERDGLTLYSKALLGMALHQAQRQDERNMVLRNIEQFLVEDEENQTAHLQLDNRGYWWFWYGNDIETQAAYLKLLVAVDPRSTRASGLVKYLLNNRSHGTYWNSTRDTAYCIEAIADYFQNSGESKPDLNLQVLIDGEVRKEVAITSEDIFDYENQLNLTAEELESGDHTIEFRKSGEGPIYFNAYLTNFTKEDPISSTGLEVKVRRRYYKLTPKDSSKLVSGQDGQAILQDISAYNRSRFWGDVSLKSGDLVEVELILESKNDYEYLIIEDPKAAGMEALDVRSGYFGQLGAYRELRDEKVAFFIRSLPEGEHTLKYQLKAEIPGKFSALPARVEAMYAPELRANADEAKVTITDR